MTSPERAHDDGPIDEDDQNTGLHCLRTNLVYTCGHLMEAKYKCCGWHVDDPGLNFDCHNRYATTTVFRTATITVGTKKCGDWCAALMNGWFCCTCGGKYTKGFKDPNTSLPVHVYRDGDVNCMHGFCSDCKIYESPAPVATESSSTVAEPGQRHRREHNPKFEHRRKREHRLSAAS